MVNGDRAEPVDVVDRQLWRDAQEMLERHAGDDHAGTCVWCGFQWPCPPRRLAERAAAAALRPGREAWTARHDLNALRTLPSWRMDLRVRGDGTRAGRRRRGGEEAGRAVRWSTRHSAGFGLNRGPFD